MNSLTELDRKIIVATQAGLPMSTTPYKDLALKLNCSEKFILDRLQDLLNDGIIRRVALVPNHYKIGYVFNGMTVWKIKEDKVSSIGKEFAQLDFVSHCYRRKIYPGEWEFNLFAMIHGPNIDVCNSFIKQMQEVAENSYIEMTTLYSTEILKKTGIRIKR